MATALKIEELETCRKALLALQTRLQGDVDQLTDEALNGTGSEATGNLSNMPLHMADLGTENYEQEFSLGLIESERATLEEIRDALIRIDQGTFGVCEECQNPIAKNRLQAIPYARYCITCARKLENR
jgi:RNA polymerase-binding protein DksA